LETTTRAKKGVTPAGDFGKLGLKDGKEGGGNSKLSEEKSERGVGVGNYGGRRLEGPETRRVGKWGL